MLPTTSQELVISVAGIGENRSCGPDEQPIKTEDVVENRVDYSAGQSQQMANEFYFCDVGSFPC